ELDNDDGITSIAASESRHEKKQKDKSVRHVRNSAESIRDAQTDHPTKPQGESSAAACCLCTLRCSID
ncbi:MAG: hypothetical protein ACRD2L_12015, partial [Terriglobia bacterium]